MTRRKVAENPLLGPIKPFRPRGESGLEVSDFLPEIAEHADELCVIRSLHGDSVNHPQSVYQMNTGSILMGQPSVGSWVALWPGEREPRPAGVRRPARSGRRPEGRPARLGQRLPAGDAIRASRCGRASTPILHLQPQPAISRPQQRATLDLVQRAQPRAPGRARRRRRAGGPHQRLRAGLPHAGRRAGAGRSAATRRPRRSRCTASTKRRPTSSASAACWPAGWSSAACGSCRSIRATPTAGTPTTTCDKNHAQLCRATDKPVAGLLTRPQAPRPVERHAGDLGRRVRPHADERARQGPRPQPLGLHASGWPAAA